MFKRMMLIKKRPDITREEFIKYYEEKHLPLCMSLLPPPRMHRRNYPDPNDALGRAMQASRESGPPPEYDCINEVIHDTREDAEAYFRAISDPNIQALIHADEKNFIAPGGITVYIVEVREQRCP